MKHQVVLILIALILSSCNPKISQKTILGSWYNFNKSNNEYHEIHIDDSLFVYIYDNADILLPFDYKLNNDTLYLGAGLDSITKKYKVSRFKRSSKKLFLKDEYEGLVFTKLDTTIQNLNKYFVNFESLDSFSYDYYKRKMIFIDEHNK
mgnify:CR=1 FL=1